MIKYHNFSSGIIGECFREGSKVLTDFSIPVEVMADGTCRYIQNFGISVVNNVDGRVTLKRFNTKPFVPGDDLSKALSDVPIYEVPSIFRKKLDMDCVLPVADEAENDKEM